MSDDQQSEILSDFYKMMILNKLNGAENTLKILICWTRRRFTGLLALGVRIDVLAKPPSPSLICFSKSSEEVFLLL